MSSRASGGTLAVARLYRDNGLNVIPIYPRSKQPVVDWQQYQLRLSTPEELVVWFARDNYGLAVVCGFVSRNLIVVDFDTMPAYDRWIGDDMERWLFPTVQTSRGRHVYIRLAQGVELPANHHYREENIDIRSNGGLATLPPSIHPSGHVYSWVMADVTKIPTLDAWSRLGLPEPKPIKPTPVGEIISGEIPYRIKPFVYHGADKGNRDNRAFWAACVCAEQGVPMHKAITYVARGLAASNPDRDATQWATEKVKSAYQYKGRL